MNKVICVLAAIFLAFQASAEANITVRVDTIALDLIPSENGINVTITKSDKGQEKIVVSGKLAFNKNVTKMQCSIDPLRCTLDDSILTISPTHRNDGFEIKWKAENSNISLTDCFDFRKDVHWYGGPQRRVQVWPIEKMTIDGDTPYVIRKDDNVGVAERYWLNSDGTYIYLDEKNPLYVSQNQLNKTVNENNLCFISKLQNPYINRTQNFLEYSIIIKDDPKEAHLHAVNSYLGKPVGHPQAGMISEPIWTTWAKYKRDINDASVVEFAKSIRDKGYENGQLEIDDVWEKCYGAQEFTPDKFSNISGVVKQLKNMNFRVTLWIHPFVNDDCQNNAQEGIDKGYFVKSQDGLTNATWWNGNQIGHQIDFTNANAASWWSNRIIKLKNDPEIDSFKFDAGETDYGQQPSVYPNLDQEQIPNILTASYIRTCAQFGNLIEVRSAWRTQDLPIFVRMLDKDTSWEIENGLPTLVTTLLQMNLNGYTMVLPDMIGGNGYNGQYPTAELLVRWTQANTFMPAMQFSYLPWEITSTQFDAPSIVQKFVNLHKNYSDTIIKAMRNSVNSGIPVNPPIWWIDPTDPIALATDDEFLVGENILVAPVLANEKRSRMVYLPVGTWRDGNNGSLYEGPISFEYPAPIEILPYFINEKAL